MEGCLRPTNADVHPVNVRIVPRLESREQGPSFVRIIANKMAAAMLYLDGVATHRMVGYGWVAGSIIEM